MNLSIIAPSIDPVVSDELVKLQLRVGDNPADWDAVEGYRHAATQYVEEYLWRQLLTAKWRLGMDSFCSHEILLPRPPLQLVESISYVDASGELNVLDAADYQVDAWSEPGRIRPSYGKCWPSTRCGELNAVRIVFVAGWPNAEAIPAPVKMAVLQVIGSMYETREASAETEKFEMPFAAKHLLSAHRAFRFC